MAFACIYAVIAGRLIHLASTSDGQGARASPAATSSRQRARTFSTATAKCSRPTCACPSLFGEPRRLIDVDEAVELLTATLPDLNANETRERLSSKKGFVWLKREITKDQQQQIHRLGLPGIGFLAENKRVYPNTSAVSHVIGHVNIDNQGIAGIEKWLDKSGLADLHSLGFATDRQQQPVQLAVDLRVQHAMRSELLAARQKYKAKAAAGLITDVRTGEIISMVSVPDYDPNDPQRGARQGAHQSPDHRRVRNGLDLQGADHCDGARFRQR